MLKPYFERKNECESKIVATLANVEGSQKTHDKPDVDQSFSFDILNFISHNLAFQRIEPIWMLLYWSSIPNINIMTSSSCFAWHIRKVNSVTMSDTYPIPRIEYCIDKVGHAKFVSKFDLLKGYWQVPLSRRACEVSAFVTPDGLFLSCFLFVGVGKLLIASTLAILGLTCP
jgi:hypothetical protein